MAPPSMSPGRDAARASQQMLEGVFNQLPARENAPQATPIRKPRGRPKKQPPVSVQQPSDKNDGSCAASSLRAALLIRRSARSTLKPSAALATIQPQRKRRRPEDASAADLASSAGHSASQLPGATRPSSAEPSRDLGLLLELQREKKLL
eukprot:4358803-Pleurochrysis_carterae.AAC.2